MDRVVAALGAQNTMANFDTLQKADPQQLARFLQSEHPWDNRARARAHLEPFAQAAALLAAPPSSHRTDVSLRVARALDEISPDVIHKIATVIGQKLTAVGESGRKTYVGVRAVAEIFNRLDLRDGQGDSCRAGTEGSGSRREYSTDHVCVRRFASSRRRGNEGDRSSRGPQSADAGAERNQRAAPESLSRRRCLSAARR